MQAFQSGAFAEALHGWMDAAAHGDGQAARYVGVLYDTGEGVQQDQALALQWYKRAADLGDVPAMFNAAICYDSGRCGVRHADEAARWYRRAASHHFGRAEYNLALIYSQGDGVPRDDAAAQRLFASASEDGIGAARSHLPRAIPASLQIPVGHRSPVRGQDQDHDNLFMAAQRQLLSRSPAATMAAATLFGREAGQSGPNALMAQYDLAWCYENGIGVPEDRRRAYTLFLDVAVHTDDAGLRDLAEAGAAVVGRPTITASATSP